MAIQTETREYQGWANYETWAVKLWMDNDQATQDIWHTQAICLANSTPAYQNEFMDLERRRVNQLADELEQWHEDQLPELQGFAADLLNSAFGAVEWTEIAESMLTDAQEV